MMFLELLRGLLQTCYSILMFHVGLFDLVVVAHHTLMPILEMLQIIMGFLVELVEFNVFLLLIFCFHNNLLYVSQLIKQVLVFI
jgi:hypothetical protein